MAPAGRKRRSGAISRDDSDSDAAANAPDSAQARSRPRPNAQSQQQARRPQQPQARQNPPSDSDPASASDSDGGDASDNPTLTETQASVARKLLVKRLVRLALACEYSRTPIRRSEITAKVMKDEQGNNIAGGGGGGWGGRGGATFKNVFEDAQIVLRGTFGMEMQELPGKERTSLKERRAQATQAGGTQRGGVGAGGSNNSNRSWVLVSVLPRGLREEREILGRGNRAPGEEAEVGYVAFYTFVVSLCYLSGGEIAEQRLERFLRRVDAEEHTGWGSWEKVKARMLREGYLDRKKDTTGGEELVSYTVGPRGKVEVGTKGVEGLVRSVYGLGVAGEGADGPKIEEAELVKRLERSLGKRGGLGGGGGGGGEAAAASAEQSRDQSQNGTPQPQQRPQRGRPPRRRAARDDDDDDD